MITRNSKAIMLALASLSLGGTMLAGLPVAQAASPKPPAKKPAKPPKAAAPTAAQIAAGKAVYAKMYPDGNPTNCGTCHKIGDQGGSIDLSHVAKDPKHTPAWLTVAVTNPKAHGVNGMPSYADVIKGKDLTNLVAYLSSLK